MAESYLSTRIRDVLLNTKDLIPSKLQETIKKAEDSIKISTETLNTIAIEHEKIVYQKLNRMKIIKILYTYTNLFVDTVFRAVLIEFLEEESAWNILSKGKPFTYNYSEPLLPQLLKNLDHEHIAKLANILS